MKGIFTAFMLMVFLFLTSCGSSDNKSKEVETKLKQEIITLDSVSAELEKAQNDIKEATDDLDAALDELDK